MTSERRGNLKTDIPVSLKSRVFAVGLWAS